MGAIACTVPETILCFSYTLLSRDEPRNLSRTLNCDFVQRDTPRFCRAYQLLLGARVVNATPPDELVSTAQCIISQKCCTVPLPLQLDILARGKRIFNGTMCSKLYKQ